MFLVLLSFCALFEGARLLALLALLLVAAVVRWALAASVLRVRPHSTCYELQSAVVVLAILLAAFFLFLACTVHSRLHRSRMMMSVFRQ